MKFLIHWEYKGEHDSVEVEGETVADVQAKAAAELEKRNLSEQYAWSEQID